ncbi:MAG: hypothetical protein ACYSUN_08400 [Planctomycetota bacterium]|jgi:hypothetical protein
MAEAAKILDWAVQDVEELAEASRQAGRECECCRLEAGPAIER